MAADETSMAAGLPGGSPSPASCAAELPAADFSRSSKLPSSDSATTAASALFLADLDYTYDRSKQQTSFYIHIGEIENNHAAPVGWHV